MNTTSFNRLFLLYKPGLYRYACSLCRNSLDAEDLVQETYLQARKSLEAVRRDDLIRSFLTSILRNLHHNRQRRTWMKTKTAEGKRFVLLTCEVPDTRYQPHSELMRKEQKEKVHRALGTLPDKLKEPLLLHQFGKKNYLSIAALKRIPVGTVRSRIHRGKKKLHSLLARDYRCGPGERRK